MRKSLATLLSFGGLLLWMTYSAPAVLAHSVQYEVQPKGISAKIFYGADDPASYSEYELYGPGDAEAYQVGRTDKAGIVSFLPDRPGIWKIKVMGESSHGFHGVTLEVKVDRAFQLESFSKPLVAQYTKVIVGVSLIFGLSGLYALWRSMGKHPLPPRTRRLAENQPEEKEGNQE